MILLLIFFPVLLLGLWLLRSPSSRVRVRDQHVLITGGSSGIGLEFAKLAASEGARKVTLLARNSQNLAEATKTIVDSLGSSRTEVGFVSADVCDYSSVEKAIEECGPVDVLVCSHGLAIPGSFVEASVNDFRKMVDINYVGTLHVVKAVLPGMMKGDGGKHARSISIFSSQAAQAGIYGLAAYAGTKSALVTFAQGLKQELFQHNIQVSLIYPPDTDTPGFKEESKIKPEITKVISASSAAMEATDVARKSLEGIKAGKFNVSCNFDGYFLGVVCSGMSPQTSALDAALEVLLLPLVRIISLYTQSCWYKTISQLQNKEKKYV